MTKLNFLEKFFSVKNKKSPKYIIKKKVTIIGLSFSLSVNKPKVISKFATMFIFNKKNRKHKRKEIYEDLKYRTGRHKEEIDFIEAQIKKHKYVYAIVSLNWNSPLHQRPHQIAKCFAKENGIFLYAEKKPKNYKLRKVGNIIFFNKEYLFHLSHKVSKKLYLIVPNVENSFSFQICQKLRKRGVNLIYDYIDDFSELIIRNNKTQRELFENLEQIDFCLFCATAKNLYNQLVSRLGKDQVILIPNGVKVEDFRVDAQNSEYTDSQNVLEYCNNKPIVGYYGALAEWIDWDMLNEVHKMRPQYNFVYFGFNYDKSIEKLNPADNVFVSGEKAYPDIPYYAKFFDCCIIPFRNGDVAKATNPIKLFEYMSMKKPIVCTKDLIECWGYDGVLIADGSYDFASKLDEAIALADDECIKNKLYSYALENTWTKRVLDLDAKIREIRNKPV